MVNHVVLMTLCQHILSFTLSLASLKFSTSIIFNKKLFQQAVKFSPVISLYFVFLFIDGTLAATNYFYLIIFWRPETNLYDARIVFWLGFLPFILAFLGPIVEVFLCVDRCLSILFPLQYTSRSRLQCSYATVIGFGIGIFGILYFNALIEVAPSNSSTTCITFGCLLYKLTTKNLSMTKFVLAGTSLFSGVILCILVRFSLKSHNINNRGISNSILIVIISTIFFEISPNIISTVISNTTGKFLTDYVGPFAVTFSAINITVCATVYTAACKKAFNYTPTNNNKMVVFSSRTIRRSTTHA